MRLVLPESVWETLLDKYRAVVLPFQCCEPTSAKTVCLVLSSNNIGPSQALCVCVGVENTHITG